jgi:hypothetical protein
MLYLPNILIIITTNNNCVIISLRSANFVCISDNIITYKIVKTIHKLILSKMQTKFAERSEIFNCKIKNSL